MYKKEQINEYADNWYLVWLEDRINYIQNTVKQLQGCLSVYQELIAEAEAQEDNHRQGFGWIPGEKAVSSMNEVIKLLDIVLCGILAHQQSLISAKLASERMEDMVLRQQQEQKSIENDNHKHKTSDPAIQ